ncbi:bifunctional UDP-N-acetylmuramoyl-tripeptide:D-alanyl-D-alanine ligase/alanine racemase [Mongoliitalea daihaiensis]|uniref:bifunctional UDP-N-acetylmuramoyl-tripeptide:D-alanyl-D-alanine ligase/alanine racemase n=1 Tax=Mongoliitalea daihaiensis TaxID=2782006 RepID=UPI001F1AD206|nr:bifunctional UDP-N-acetylmuramoyl-tripeptide:D-alanyl-D-alanine ligase/alanine racemase [Mongoliitalea daihaiensis]UJP65668.1 bifunctional UDP-N-acetylmuramoyl-tripeptide:D-alanyl-D-alanine ligase/alanine racemase [Mongoliitalea daihaiensis]
MLRELSVQEIVKITAARLEQGYAQQSFAQVSIDSRTVSQPYNTLFVALKGAKFDGHQFIPELIAQGVKGFLVKKGIQLPQLSRESLVILEVADTHEALQALAAYQRSLFEKPLVAITGSNGKTIIKEWLGQLLGTAYALAKSPKSYNSQVGVPLSVFGIKPYHQVAVMEAGISKVGEMRRLESILKPDIGIFSNIGTAHEEGFDSQLQKLIEKAQLFVASKFIIYRKEHVSIASYLEKTFAADRLIAWSDQAGADYTLSVKKEGSFSKIILLKPDLSMFTFTVPFTDEASLENIRHAIVASMVLGLQAGQIQQVLRHLRPVEMRLTLKAGIHDCLLIDDTYNNDLAGLRLALDFMAAQRQKNRRILILSDLLQVGEPTQVYREVASLLEFYQIDQLIGIGTQIQQLKTFWKGSFIGYQETAQFLQSIKNLNFHQDLILVTGARAFALESIVARLQQQVHGTVLEINLNALTHNYNFYKTQLKPSTKVMVMVKAFAYGGGASEIANHVEQLKADYLAVAYSDEGVSLREAGIRLPMMVLNPLQESFGQLLQHTLEPVVYSPQFFKELGYFCRNQSAELSIHLDLDTGMNRLGFKESDLPELIGLLKKFPELRVASMYTHLVGTDEDMHDDFSMHQLHLFQKMATELEHQLGYQPLKHALNSGGIVRFPEFQFDMVRLGIGLYGVEVNGRHDTQLKPVSVLKTTISQIKEIEPGESIGYSRKGYLPKGGRIATIAIGYADGFDRRFSNGVGFVLIHGQKAPVVGNVCMDMCMVDISGIDAQEGDQVIIYGPGISLKELATTIATIPYELLTNISSRVKRVYFLD